MVQPINISNVLSSLEYLGQANRIRSEREEREKAKKGGIGGTLGGIAGTVIGSYYGGPVGGAAGGAAGSYIGAKVAGGDASSQQIASSGMQGYQMGQQQQQQQNNTKFNTAMAENIESDPNATPQQKQYATYLKKSNQDPNTSMQQAQYLGVEQEKRDQRAILTNINTGTVDKGINYHKELQGFYLPEDPEYSALQKKIDGLEDLKTKNLASVQPQAVEGFIRSGMPKKTRVYTDEDTGMVIAETSDPFSGEKNLTSLGKTNKGVQKIVWVGENGKVQVKNTTASPTDAAAEANDLGGEVVDSGKDSVILTGLIASKKDKDSQLSPTLKTAAKIATDYIIEKVGGMPGANKNVQQDLAMIENLSKVPSGNETQAQKQIDEIKKRYEPEEGTKGERDIAFMEDVISKFKNNKPVSDEDMMRYRTLWLKTSDKTTTTDATGNKSLVRESGYPTLNELRNQQLQPQSRVEGQGVLVSDTGAVQESPITAAQEGSPISTPFSETVQVGEKTWQKSSLNDFETVKSLGQYSNALNEMETNVGDVAWANSLAPLGSSGNEIAKFVTKKIPQGALNAVGIKPGAKRFVAAYSNQVIAMQQMVKGNPSDRDIGMMLESTAEMTNDPGYNREVIKYNQTQVRSALKMKLEMMLAEKKKITPEMEAVAQRSGINISEIYKAAKKSPKEAYDSNMNEIRKNHAQFASLSGDNYRPKSSISFEENGEEKTYLGRPAEYLLSTDNKLFNGVNYTPRMAKEIVKDKSVYDRLSKEEKLKLLNSVKGNQQLIE